MSKLKFIVATLLVFLFVGGCSPSAETETGEDGIERMTGANLQEIQDDKDAKEEMLVIDVRPEDQYKEGHVRHAISMPLEDDFEGNLGRLDNHKDLQIVVYCNSDNMSSQAAEILTNNGFENVVIAEGVKEFDYDTVTYESVLPEELFEAVDNEDAIIIDVRPTEDYEKGALPGAINHPLDTKETVLDDLPEDKDALIYTYCFSGNQSGEMAVFLTEQGYTNVHNSLDGTKENDKFPLEVPNN